jgi:glutamate formiminotransferase
VPLLECVPNISEGRRLDVVERLARAATPAGVRLLDLTSDPDHNRSVLTLAGEADALLAGMLALFEAAAVIDLRQHSGVHPRIGAVDVVPFVPLAGSTMDEAVTTARQLAPLVAERFALPVYLYEHAARRDDRRALPQIRRGGFEGLAEKMRSPGGVPDFGPAQPHPTSGATVIGARFFLIAFNVLLATADVGVARRLARSVRESSGGLPAVRALGVWLASRGCAQVSLNLLDYRQTSPLTALRHIQAEAERVGVTVRATELVGLMPEDAAVTQAGEALLLGRPLTAGIIEKRLAETGR